MPGRGNRRRSAVSRGLNGLSVLALCAFVIGAVFILTSNQGCIRLSGRTPSTYPPAGMNTAQPKSDTARNESPKSEDAPQSPAPEARQPDEERPSEEEKPADESPSQPVTSEPPPSPAPMPRDVPGEVSHGSTASTRIALTFDAGAASQPVDKILKTLSKHGVRCTFFLTGKWIEKNPALCRRIVAEGHEIGNHSYSHRSFTQLSDREIGTELERTEELAIRVTGASTKPLFRPPYGARDKRVLRTVGGLGYRSIYWHVDCWDSVKAGITPDQINKRVLGLVRNGSIVLMHCGSQATADALDGLLDQLKTRGYQPVTVGTLIGS